jgi:DNA-binding CsgD family transcriptional regulator
MATVGRMRAHVVPQPDPVDRVVEYLQDGTHVRVAGVRGSGRSTVLAQVAERLTALRVPVVTVRGMRTLRDRPLAALAVAGVPLATSTHQLRMLTSAVDGLEQQLATRAAVLLVDDSDELDDASLSAVIAAHLRLGTRVVTTGRPDRDGGMLGAELQPAARIELGPLRFAEVHRLVHAHLGRGVEPATVARIAVCSGGLPGLVLAMVDTARREDRLVLRDGLWVARGDLWAAPLRQTVEPLLADLDEEGRDALTTLSFAGPVPLAEATALVGDDGVTGLDDAGLLRVLSDDDGRTLVGVVPPAVADYLVHESPHTRGLRAAARVADARGGRAAQPPVPQGAHVTDPVVGRLIGGHWSGRHARLRRLWEQDPAGDPALTEDLVEAMRLDHARPYEVAEVREQAACAAGAGAGLAAGGAGEADDPAGADPELARAARAEHLVAIGQVGAAGAVLDGFTPEGRRARRVAGTARGLVQLYSCEVGPCVRDALAGVEQARQDLDPVALLAHAGVAGLALAVQGRAVDLAGLAWEALALPTACPHEPGLVTGLIALAAEAATWQGHRDLAESLAVQAAAMDPAPGPHPYQAAGLVEALIRDDEDPAVAAQTADAIWAVAQDRFDAGYLPAGVLAGVLAVDRCPDPDRAAELVAVAQRCDAPLLTHLAGYATVVASGDPELLAAAEPVLRAAGLRQFAVRAAVARAVRLLADGQPAAAVERADTAWSQGGLRGRDLCGLFLPFDRAVRLTVREREVAVHVARGLSSPEIADRMVLSARTVEHHILSACRKVGVNSRDGLARAARTWLTCTVR